MNNRCSVKFISKLWQSKDYIVIPAHVYQKWKEEFSQISEIHGPGGTVFPCSVSHASRGRARLITNFTTLRQIYRITNPVEIRFRLVKFVFLSFAFGLQQTKLRKSRSKRRRIVPNKSTTTSVSTPSNVLVPHPIWGADVPLWETTISRSMARGGQPLVIPAHVVQTRLTTRPGYVLVSLATGVVETWNLIWNEKRPSQCHFGHGWYNFLKNNCIQFGDKLQFWAGDNGTICVTKYNGE